MRALQLILGAIVIILLMGAMLAGITSFRTQDYTEQHDVTTGANVTSSAITLSQELFGAHTYNAEVTSNITADAPIPSSYVEASQALTVTGLDDSNSRRLTVVYKISSLDDYWGADLGARAWPLFLVLGVIGIIVGAVVVAARGRD